MVTTTDLLAYWKLDNNATDSHASLDLTAVAAPSYAAGIINNGVDLESGSNQALTRAVGDLYPTLPFSINMWFKPESTPNSCLMAKYAATDFVGTRYEIFLLGAADKIRVKVTNSAGTPIVLNSTSTVSIGNWSMITLVANGTNLKIYMNGSSEGTPPALTNLYHSAEQRFDLGRSQAGAYPTDGVIDEVGIWDRELTSTEVSELYNSGNGLAYPFGAVVGTNMNINITDNFKDIDSIQINIGNAWKDVTKVQQNIGDAWKDVY